MQSQRSENEEHAQPSPWLAFFRQVRVLAAQLDALEAEADQERNKSQ